MRWLAWIVGLVLASQRAALGAAGAVATEHQRAADAGAAVLRDGGSVVDAAIAAAATVCVIHASSCGIGGGSLALVHLHGDDAALDFRERAPAAATLDRYLRDGQPDPTRTRSGGLAVAVPGEVAGWVELHHRFGRLTLARVLAPAIALARDGFPLSETEHLRRDIDHTRALAAADPGLRATFLNPDGTMPDPSFRVVQRDLAATLETVATRGRDAFYAGPIARAIADAVTARGGVLTVDDLAAYRPIWRTPLFADVRGHRVMTFPPPGGGAVVLTIVGQLAGDDLPVAMRDPGPWAHLLAGAMAQGFADRARWYGDPDATPVPIDALLAPARLRALRARLDPRHVVEPIVTLTNDAGTAHVSVIDADGNAAAITTTINTGFGSGIMVPGTGIVLNNEMDDFALATGVANAYGLTGNAANLLAPGKRPQSSMSPTIVLRNSRAELVVGGSGGPTIISGVAQVLLRVFGAGETPQAAVSAPRLHDQAVPPGVAVEPTLPPDTRAFLESVGHTLREVPFLGSVSVVGRGHHGELLTGLDPRKDGGAAVTTVPAPAARRPPSSNRGRTAGRNANRRTRSR